MHKRVTYDQRFIDKDTPFGYNDVDYRLKYSLIIYRQTRQKNKSPLKDFRLFSLAGPADRKEGTHMPSTIIAITNQEGGVGKTTTAAALLTSLTRRGARVLGVDLDPQGSLGFSLGLDIERCTTIYDVFRGAVEPEEAISHSDTCDLLASNILLSGAELEFNRPGREFMLKTALSRLEGQYDYIIVDTPPALNLLTVNAYVASDSLIIPMAPEVLSLLGVAQIKETIESVRSYYNPRLQVLGILLNRYSARFNLNREVLDLAGQIAAQLNTRVFETKIRGSVAAAEAPAHGVSVVDYAPRSKPAQDFEALCDEVAGDRFPAIDETGGDA